MRTYVPRAASRASADPSHASASGCKPMVAVVPPPVGDVFTGSSPPSGDAGVQEVEEEGEHEEEK